MNIWERHGLLSSTIGVMNIEQVSYDNVTSLFYMVVILFPLLAILEICLYCLYQFKVNKYLPRRLNPPCLLNMNLFKLSNPEKVL